MLFSVGHRGTPHNWQLMGQFEWNFEGDFEGDIEGDFEGDFVGDFEEGDLKGLKGVEGILSTLNNNFKLFRLENLDYFFPDISTPQSREILLLDAIPFSILVRKVRRDYVVSYLGNKCQVRDERLPTRLDTTLRLHRPHLNTQEGQEGYREVYARNV